MDEITHSIVYLLDYGNICSYLKITQAKKAQRTHNAVSYRKESMNNITDAMSPLIRFMALARSQTTRLVRPCWDINKWRVVGNNTFYYTTRKILSANMGFGSANIQ